MDGVRSLTPHIFTDFYMKLLKSQFVQFTSGVSMETNIKFIVRTLKTGMMSV
jgi:hypothetical protein